MGREDSYEMEERSELFYAVMELPVKYRTVIHLFYYEGYTVKEIAGLLEEKVTTITTRLSRGRERLREVLDAEAAGESKVYGNAACKKRAGSKGTGGRSQSTKSMGKLSVAGQKETYIRF